MRLTKKQKKQVLEAAEKIESGAYWYCCTALDRVINDPDLTTDFGTFYDYGRGGSKAPFPGPGTGWASHEYAPDYFLGHISRKGRDFKTLLLALYAEVGGTDGLED